MTDGLGIMSIKMLLALIIMLGLIFALVYVLKRLKIGTLSGGGSHSMRLLGYLSLAPKKGIALVEVCDQWIVIGVGSDTVNLISRVERPACDAAPDVGYGGGGSAFQSILEGFGLSRKNQRITDPGKNERI
ncbi:MAG: flagellar biosynthetic protein FliO [Deltaproteobacteria bacterium]|nr:flagellar biosynthetic protein FliO [Deltaproteobacteria bacterium]